MDERERTLNELIRYAEASSDVIGLYVFGSRGRPDGLADDASDYDVGVVLRDDADLDAFDARWPFVHGAPVEVARATLSELHAHGEYGSPSAWSRPLYERVDLRVDKTGEVTAALDAKRGVPPGAREAILRESLDAYINATYRSLRYGLVGAGVGTRFDAAAAASPLLDFLFALERRVRPFNKYLEREILERPFRGELTIDRLLAVLDGDAQAQHGVFRDIESIARDHGLGEIVDAWEPDVAWLRGDEPYRAT